MCDFDAALNLPWLILEAAEAYRQALACFSGDREELGRLFSNLCACHLKLGNLRAALADGR